MKGKHWNVNELGTHSYASEPHYRVHMYGKVDINPETGNADHKIELRVEGMYSMVNDWIETGHQLSEDKRKALIDKLSVRGRKTYNTITKEWQDND